MDVLIGTHHQSARGHCELTILSPAGHVVRSATVDLATARDNDWLRFDFAPIANATGYPFRLRFALIHPTPPPSSASTTPSPAPRGWHAAPCADSACPPPAIRSTAGSDMLDDTVESERALHEQSRRTRRNNIDTRPKCPFLGRDVRQHCVSPRETPC